MNKLFKPLEGHPDYQCFGCSPSNPIGLNLEFQQDGDFIVAYWKTQPQFQGFKNMLHGGIQSTLMDEVAAWCVNIQCETHGVTQHLSVQYHKSVFTTGQTIKIRGKVEKMIDNIAFIHVELFNQNEVLCSEAHFEFFTFPLHIALNRLHYPGKEAFFKPSIYLKK
jgi:uncharacterized protein (TIGR00369 family)